MTNNSKLRMLEEAISQEEVQLIIESISADDLRQFARMFKTYQTIVSGFNLPSIENFLDEAREDFAEIAEPKTGILSRVAGALGGDRKKKKQIFGRLVKTQTQLRNLFLQLEDILTIIDSDLADLRQESLSKQGRTLNEDTMRQIAKSLNMRVSAVRKVARELGWTKGPNVEMPNKMARVLTKELDKDSISDAPKTKSEEQREENRNKTIRLIISPSTARQFKKLVESALRQDRGFFAKVFSKVQVTEKDLDPETIVEDLLQLTYEEISILAERSKILKNEDIDKKNVEDFMSGEKNEKTEESNSDIITSQELYQSLSNSEIGKNLGDNEISAIVSVLKGKTIK